MSDIRIAPAGRGLAWFTEAFYSFRHNVGAWMGIGFILFIFGVISLTIPLFSLILQLFTPVLIGGLLLGCRDSSNGGQLSLHHLFAGFSHATGNLLLLGILYTIGAALILALMAGMAIIAVGGSVIVSAIINGDPLTILDNLILLLLVILVGSLLFVPLLMSVWFGPALIVFEGYSPLHAMKHSFLGCVKNTLAFLVYGLVGLVLAVFATLPLMLGWIVLLPVTIIGFYLSYRDIYAQDVLLITREENSHVS
jgi:hypothetical protein